MFNWHPLYMVVGMVFFYTESLLAYRTLPFGKKMNKIFHGFLHVMAMIFVVVGLVAVFKSHNYKNSGGYIANLYSMHSWLGLATIVLFGQNYFLGLLHFFLPSCASEDRAAYLPSHVFLGIFTYFCAAFTVISGITEKNAFMGCAYKVDEADLNPAEHYKDDLPDVRVLRNMALHCSAHDLSLRLLLLLMNRAARSATASAWSCWSPV